MRLPNKQKGHLLSSDLSSYGEKVHNCVSSIWWQQKMRRWKFYWYCGQGHMFWWCCYVDRGFILLQGCAHLSLLLLFRFESRKIINGVFLLLYKEDLICVSNLMGQVSILWPLTIKCFFCRLIYIGESQNLLKDTVWSLGKAKTGSLRVKHSWNPDHMIPF